MRHEERIIEAFKTNEIERILLIDDAYDPPEIDDNFAALTDFLESTAGHDACNKAGIDEDTIEAAIEAGLCCMNGIFLSGLVEKRQVPQ